jgi:Salmonella virulence plasmid 65kDa B protein
VATTGGYRLRSDNFTRILARDIDLQGTWFKVEGKDGTVYEYGRGPTSRFMDETGTKTISWHISKTYDTYGNYMEYIYETVNREILLKEIRYTGLQNNATNPFVIVNEPYNRVKFNYSSSRLDANTGYINGSVVKMNSLLTSIETYADQAMTSTTPDKKWEFSYGKNTTNVYMNEVTESARVPTTTTYKKFNPTQFKYGAEGTQEFQVVNPQINSLGEFISCDLNGDGFTDLLKVNKGIMPNATLGISYIRPLVYNNYGECIAVHPPYNPAVVTASFDYTGALCDNTIAFGNNVVTYDFSKHQVLERDALGKLVTNLGTHKSYTVPNVPVTTSIQAFLNLGNNTYQTSPEISLSPQELVTYVPVEKSIINAINYDCTANVISGNRIFTNGDTDGSYLNNQVTLQSLTKLTRRGKFADTEFQLGPLVQNYTSPLNTLLD